MTSALENPRRDPAGFTDIIPKTIVQIVNFGPERSLFQLNGQLAQVIYFDRHARAYVIMPYFAPHIHLHVRPENIAMPLYAHPPQIFSQPTGLDGIVLARTGFRDIPTNSQFNYAASRNISIVPTCNSTHCTEPAAINDLCQYHAMRNIVSDTETHHPRYLFRIPRPPPDPPNHRPCNNSEEDVE